MGYYWIFRKKSCNDYVKLPRTHLSYKQLLLNFNALFAMTHKYFVALSVNIDEYVIFITIDGINQYISYTYNNMTFLTPKWASILFKIYIDIYRYIYIKCINGTYD